MSERGEGGGGVRERERERERERGHNSLQAMLDFLEVKGEAIEASPSLTS